MSLHNRIVLLTPALLATVAALGLPGPVHPQGQRESVIRPSDGPGQDRPATVPGSREELARQVQQLRVRMELAAEALRKLRQGNNGDKATAIKINLISVVLEKDAVDVLPPVEAAVEQLKWALVKDHAGKEALAGRRLLDNQRTQRDIDRLAEEVVRLEERRSDQANAAEAEQLDQALLNRKAELHELIQLRQQRSADAKELAAGARASRDELAGLKQLQGHLDSLASQSRYRVARYLDAIEYQSVALVAEEIDRSRKSITDALALLRSRPPAPTVAVRASPAAAQSVPVSPRVVQPPPAEDSELLRAELQKTRERLKARGPVAAK